MSLLGGRGGRSDDWSSQHARARARAAELVEGPLETAEAAWLDEHLAACAECAGIAAEYAAQAVELRGLRERAPVPPRDLWARTAAAIEGEAGHGVLQPSSRPGRSTAAPYALLAGALAVAVAVATLTSSQRFPTSTPSAGATDGTIAATHAASAGPTPLAVAQEVDFLGRGGDGEYHLYRTNVSSVCPREAGTCAATEPNEEHSIGPLPSPESVYGSGDAPLVVLGDSESGSSVYVVARPDPNASPPPDPTPSAEPTPTPTTTATAVPTPSGSAPSPTPDPTPTPPVESPPPSPLPGGAVEIARGVEVVDTTAAYAPDGTAFAFTARPADGSHGPDIYLWRVGDAEARPITSDHRSVFGSWAGDLIVGSTVVDGAEGEASEPAAFVLDSAGTTNVPLPETGLAWRPAVDPGEGSAVYWAGTLEATDDDLGWRTVAGRLVLGRWSVGRDTSASPDATPLTGDQSEERRETTIAEGPISDWDARWDKTGTRLAIWIADPEDPTVGLLSLYVVDPFDGTIDLANPPLEDAQALAGFSITDGRLAWAAPPDATQESSRVLILAWTDEGFGQVESAPGDFLLVR